LGKRSHVHTLTFPGKETILYSCSREAVMGQDNQPPQIERSLG
jgi:hypothetical protein